MPLFVVVAFRAAVLILRFRLVQTRRPDPRLSDPPPFCDSIRTLASRDREYIETIDRIENGKQGNTRVVFGLIGKKGRSRSWRRPVSAATGWSDNGSQGQRRSLRVSRRTVSPRPDACQPWVSPSHQAEATRTNLSQCACRTCVERHSCGGWGLGLAGSTKPSRATSVSEHPNSAPPQARERANRRFSTHKTGEVFPPTSA